jgi:hypothetical protein
MKDGYSSICKDCRKEDRQNNKEKYAEQDHKTYLKRKDRKSETNALHHLKNKDIILERKRKYRKENPDIINAQTAKRRARIKNAITPDTDFEAIKKLYKEAKILKEQTGIPHEVDHIIPLSKDGLHHQDNLQVLTESENRRKYNKLPGDNIV